jgi:hypothetical protein
MKHLTIISALLLTSTLTLSGCFKTSAERAEERAEQARVEALYRLQQAERRELSYQNMCEGYGYQQNTPQFNQCVVAERRNYAVEREAARTREIARQAAERASQAAKRAQLAEERARLTQIIQNSRATQERINSIGSGSDCWTPACIRAEVYE